MGTWTVKLPDIGEGVAEAELVAKYRERFNNPYIAAGLGYVDDVIMPRDTRSALIRALELCGRKRDANPAKKHGNIPL